MIALNLTANGMEQNLIKEFLQNNVNEFLADKINNGVKITKDNKTLINKKTLDGFMNYAASEAQKLAQKGAKFACLHHDTVFGWAMHYFEENDIEGTLYNEDGTEFNPVIKKTSRPTITHTSTPYVPPVKKPEPQMSFFDMLSTKTEEPIKEETLAIDNDEPTEEDIKDAFCELEKEQTVKEIKAKAPTSPMYVKYLNIQKQYPNSVIAYRLGDFFEIFGDNAVKLSNQLDLTLTGRDCGLTERIPMIGFPYHTSDAYFKKIIQNNSLIVIDGDNKYEYKITVDIPPNIDRETGEIIASETTANNEIIKKLQAIFGDTMEIKL